MTKTLPHPEPPQEVVFFTPPQPTNQGGHLSPAAFSAYLLALVFMAFGKTRLLGVFFGAFFLYRYPLAGLMVGITVVVVAYLFIKWRNRNEQLHHPSAQYGDRLGSTRRGPGRRH